ncbi:protein of unknown function [Methylorubrum extorquens DM4]|uniref:Uncharacterized protein n=1 Tax=Methylorubrum extorquens (strain DSM 6343 / CIP 106787 / DM4) TaxID=661410 RepID=C7C6K1_METED|nr:hypothetical protein [Methylorubrum extorquens]CAX21723.1 protein of unknown function [Methylorubrum extorquens DM4]
MTDEEFAELERVIQGREEEVAARIATLLSLSEAGFDTTEAEAALWRKTDSLTVLRQYQATIVEERDP